ncbi:restriction endonuclease subunit S [Citrobacter freundii]|uniref:restriction endonuclease subunit S n=1 Tax=Citrobacter freundii TaxID=546 RepID=UPI0029388C37|nr:restriction endonuclease subunit S [Citrobacter freundii]ELQ7796718.1 restriction endonuclease subunit S [Citrobacter freundii]MEA8854415.1 restriction endonuclease subunit S [Citrobacter freundii]MEB0999405.1 restriction endonuclease subunit S [Citrobacter freundii]
MSAGKLPEGWATAPVSTVTTLIRGVTYKKEQALNYLQDDYLPLIRANNIQNGKFDTTDLVFVPKNLVKESQKISPEDIVIAMSSGSKSVVGKSAHQRLPFECSFGAFCGALRPEKLISPNFIAHFTKSSFYRNKISSLSAGANINNIKPASFDLINIPIPSLAEQKIIAEKLDTLLAQVDSTKARLEQIPQILKRFRQAVLASATSGKLTETWRQNNNLRHPKEIIIDNIVESSFYGPRFSKNDYTFETNGIPTIRTTDMERGNIIITDSTPRVCVPNEKIEQLKVQKNDLLITRTGSIGVMALFTEDYIAIPSAYLIRFRFKKNINSKYIYLCLTAPKGQQQMGLSATAITQSNINAKSIRNINICYPDIAEQAEIVRRVEQLFAYADTIEKQVNNALTRVNSLTQSILAKAFRGELTAQWRAENPSLISGENSAAALLEKIKAERAASGGKKASRKKA